MSVHSYTKGAAPYDHLIDYEIAPNEGASNPFQSGSFSDNQAYTIRVMQGETPNERAANTLYLGNMEEVDRSPLMIRHYIPETGDDLTGGAGLPQVTLVRGNGEKSVERKLVLPFKALPLMTKIGLLFHRLYRKKTLTTF